MMESKFTPTPGPWLRDGRTVYALDETGNCNRFSVLLEGGWTYRSAGSMGASSDRTNDAELLANATLIAAAPDLLEALEKARKRVPDEIDYDNLDAEDLAHRLMDISEITWAAIARARGNQS